jgi:hypothetical protein
MDKVTNSQTYLLYALGAVALIGGALGQFLEPSQPFGAVVVAESLIGVFFVFLWFRTDAERLGFKRSLFLNIAVVGLALVALPYYFIRSRGLRGGTIAILFFFAALVAWAALKWLGAMTVYALVQS